MAGDEVWRLQRENDRECRLFRKLVNGKDDAVKGTMQGIYIFAPDGTLYGRRNTNRASDVLKMMADALATMGQDATEIKPAEPLRAQGRWEDNFPTDGLVLRRTARDIPADGNPASERARRWNRDAVWISARELQTWLPFTSEVPVGYVDEDSIPQRLARLSLVDNARGQTIPFAPQEILEARIGHKITRKTDEIIEVEFKGRTKADAKGPWLLGECDWKPKQEWPHTLRTEILGKAVWDRKKRKFLKFELLAMGYRTGRTINCGRGADPAPGKIAYFFELAPPSWRVAPTFIDMYDVDWVRHPKSSKRSPEKSFSLRFRVKTTQSGEDFPLLLTNKDWGSGVIKDYTTNHAYGRSRTSGGLPGFALAIQPNGSWSWNISDGKRRFDYRPTFQRQPINDGKAHFIKVEVDRQKNVCRLYYDSLPVAVYSINGLGSVGEGDQEIRMSPDVSNYEIETSTSGRGPKFGRDQRPFQGAPPHTWTSKIKVGKLKVLAWNIWHGGRRDGNEVGLQKTIDIIKKTDADIICMQETYGSGAVIADALGYYFYLRSTNLSVMSRYPIVETHDLFQPFRLGGVTIQPSESQKLKVFSLWINSSPNPCKTMEEDEVTVERLLADEEKTRAREIRDILKTLEPHLRGDDPTPVIVAGDFNSPSHLDWTEEHARRNRGLVVPWPVSLSMERYGFVDAFRAIHPNATEKPGRTWSPRFTEQYPFRIDYVYFKGKSMVTRSAEMLDQHPEGWPSDHAAVLTTLEL